MTEGGTALPCLLWFDVSEQLVSGSGPAAGGPGPRPPSCWPPTSHHAGQDSHRAENTHPVLPSNLGRERGRGEDELIW